MELYLQFGYGMMEHCRVLIEEWSGGTVVLSPRDLKPEQLDSLVGDIGELDGDVLLDPQFFVPRCDHARLTTHAYWPDDYSTGTFFSGAGLDGMLRELFDLNVALDCRCILLPGLLASPVDDDWLAVHDTIIERAVAMAPGLPLVATLALSDDAVTNLDQVHSAIDAAEQWDVAGYYVVCQHPRGNYLVDDPNWLANVLDLAAGLRLTRREVILGYCSHQMLVAGAASVNAIASGTWMNVRSFPPEKFAEQYGEEIKRRGVWYYCPQALSEFSLPFLDIALRLGVLDRMRAPAAMGSYVDRLFSGEQPTTVGLGEREAFRHYLQCLRGQVSAARRGTFDDAMAYNRRLLDEAESLLSDLHDNGVNGQGRDFEKALEPTRSALLVLERVRGAVLRREWAGL